jgi:hypothetical protein
MTCAAPMHRVINPDTGEWSKVACQCGEVSLWARREYDDVATFMPVQMLAADVVVRVSND